MLFVYHLEPGLWLLGWGLRDDLVLYLALTFNDRVVHELDIIFESIIDDDPLSCIRLGHLPLFLKLDFRALLSLNCQVL